MRLDIACGNNKQEGFVGVDLTTEGTQADFAEDLEKFPWSFESNSVDEVFCAHYIEHTKNLIKFMEEVWRIMKPGATATFISPYYSSVRCWQDPTHTRAISEHTYLYYNQEWMKNNGLAHYGIKANFEIVKFDYHVNEDFKDIKGADLQYAATHMINVYDDIRATLKKI